VAGETAVKCPLCGYVSLVDTGACKKCGAGMTADSAADDIFSFEEMTAPSPVPSGDDGIREGAWRVEEGLEKGGQSPPKKPGPELIPPPPREKKSSPAPVEFPPPESAPPIEAEEDIFPTGAREPVASVDAVFDHIFDLGEPLPPAGFSGGEADAGVPEAGQRPVPPPATVDVVRPASPPASAQRAAETFAGSPPTGPAETRTERHPGEVDLNFDFLALDFEEAGLPPKKSEEAGPASQTAPTQPPARPEEKVSDGDREWRAPTLPFPPASSGAPLEDLDEVPERFRGEVPADFARRSGAFLVDNLVIALVTGLFVAGAGVGFYLRKVSLTWLAGNPWQLDAALPFLILTTLINGAYFMGYHALGGRTPGKRLFSLRLLETTGAEVTTGTALLRWLAAILSLAPAGLGFLWAILDRDRLTWHDRLTGTMVVREGGETS
jgi:uncharacterized RDD family membrane protein YckC